MSLGGVRVVRLAMVLSGALALLLAWCAGSWAATPVSKPGQVVSTKDEVVSARTQTSRTFRQPDGSNVTQVASGPVNFKDARGKWQLIDTRLKSSAGGVVNTAAGVGISLPADLSGGAAKVSDGSRWVSFKLQDAGASAAKVAGSTASYANVVGLTDVSYESLAQGLKETLTLADATAAGSYRFALSASSGLSPKLRADGSVVFADAGGVVRFVLPAPTVQQAGQAEPTESHVAYRLSADGATLTVAVDRTWLAGAKFPVKVDPTVYPPEAAVACNLQDGSNANTSDCNSTTLKVGHSASDGTRRGVVQFSDLSAVPANAQVQWANLNLWFRSQTDSTADPDVDVYPLSHLPTTGATWNKHDATHSWSTAGGDFGARAQRMTLSHTWAGGPVSWTISPLVEGWLKSTATNNGLGLRVRDESLSNVLTFDGTVQPAGSGSDWGPPLLSIAWTPHMGFQRDQTLESFAIDDRSSLNVNDADGNMSVDSTDVHLPGVNGTDLSIERTYNSGDLGNQGDEFNSAWALSVNGAGLHLDDVWSDHTRVLHANGGAQYRFDRDPSGDSGGNEAYKTPPGIDADLLTHSDGTSTLTLRRSQAKWDYDANGLLTKVTDANANHIDLAYNSGFGASAGVLSSITDTYGNALSFTTNAGGYITQIQDASGRQWKYGYTTTSGGPAVLTSFTNPDNKQTTYAYETSNPSVYDSLKTVTDARGHDIAIVKDGSNRPTSVTRVVDGTTTNDVTTSYDWSPASGTGHACDSSSSPGGIVQRMVATDPRGKKTTFCSNNMGRVEQTFDALGHKTATSYTVTANVQDFSSLAGTANPSLSSFTFSPSATDNLTGGTAPAGETFSIAYCGDSGQAACSGTDTGDAYRPKAYTDEQNTKTLYAYDGSGNLTSVKDAQSPTRSQQTLTYNKPGDGTIATATDANGNQTSFSYTSHNLTTVSYPKNGSTTLIGDTTLTYDGVNRVHAITDGKGTTATVTYDGEDRITRVDYSNGAYFTFTFDDNGNQTQRADSASNTTTYGYDNLNRRTSESFPGSLSNTYSYDKTGNLASLVDGGGTTTYGYDDINRVSSIVFPKPGGGTDTVSYAYTDNSPRTQTATYPGGLTQTVSSDLSGKTTKTEVKNSGGSTLSSQAYAYVDGSNQRSLVQSMTDQANNKTAYTYSNTTEDVGHLLSAVTKASGGTGATLAAYVYAYDAAGNRLSKAVTDAAGTTTTASYAYNQVNELCWAYSGSSSNACGSKPTGGTSYTYDLAGNNTAGTSSLGYDALNRLTTTGSTSLGYLSPGNGELVSQGATSYQNNMLGLGRQIATGGNTDYTRQPNGAPISQRTSTSRRFLFTDRLGSVTGLADSSGSILRTYSYDPDGNNTTSGTGNASDLRFAGGHQLANGMTHYGARYYDPTTARWTQQDPINQIASLTEANRYSYVAGNAVNLLDPLGTSIFRKVVKAAAIAVDDARVVAGVVLDTPAGRLAERSVSGVGCLDAGRRVLTGRAGVGTYIEGAVSCGAFIATK